MDNRDLNSPYILRAARVLTMAEGDRFLHDGAVMVEGETVRAVGSYQDISRAHSAPVRDLGDVTLVPGLLNAHCHLELSALRGEIPSGLGFREWLRRLITSPRRTWGENTPEAMRRALHEMKRSGTCFVGDISTHNVEAVAGVLDDSGFFFVSFLEHILFSLPTPDATLIPDGSFARGRYSAAGHAPYSTHGELLRAAKDATLERGLPFSLHLAETKEETDALLGTSSWYTDILDRAGIGHDFTAPGVSPVAFAHTLGLLDEHTLAVHCVTVDANDISILRESGATVCLCPRSNEFITGGRAPWEGLMEAGVPLCLGTDSLASNQDLDLWNELRFVKERWRGELTLGQGLALMTVNPARALGEERLGTIEPGRAAMFATIPQDIEEMFRGS